MAAVKISGQHTVVGVTSNGKKIVFSDFTTDNGTAGITPCTIKPLVKIDQWFMGVKTVGNTSGAFTAVLGSDTSYLSGSNVIYVTPGATTTGAKLCITSIGD
ncbi:MAG TPA: hypothetical protein PLW50_00380 [Smithellaceae bacterium]|nr:hypothetical protein [Smithellaceae bacterium]